jgi:hypothetical protein
MMNLPPADGKEANRRAGTPEPNENTQAAQLLGATFHAIIILISLLKFTEKVIS